MPKKKSTITNLQKIAREKLGFKHLRPGQEDAIRSVVEGQDTLVIMPTGAGKSAIYQLAGFLLDGPTVVISPLIALQRDQVQSIAEQNVGEAALVNSTIRATDKREALENMKEGDLEFLFLAPEQFADEDMLKRVKASKPSLFVVDESHCISEWGHDFRPDYLRLGNVIDALGHPVILALTATASPPVREEIVERLKMKKPHVIVQGFDRPNIWLGREIYKTEADKQEALLARVEDAEKPGIVYTASRKHAELVAERLQEQGVRAVFYHAGMNSKEREAIQEAFMNGEEDVIVSTNAFGMGVDKENVRFVFHYDISDSVDSYYQEIGRAGRDGKPAQAILFYLPKDINIHKFFAGGGQLDPEQVQQVAELLQEHAMLSEEELKEKSDLSNGKLRKVVQRLEEVGVVEISPAGEIKAVAEVIEEEIDLSEAAKEAAKAQEFYRQFEQARIELIQSYAETGDCLRRYLLNYFGEKLERPCGHCSNCEKGLVEEEEQQNGQQPFPVKSRVTHKSLGDGLVMRYEEDKIVILFDKEGLKTLILEYVLKEDLLQPA